MDENEVSHERTRKIQIQVSHRLHRLNTFFAKEKSAKNAGYVILLICVTVVEVWLSSILPLEE